MGESKQDPSISLPDKDVKAPNVFERAQEEIEAIFHSEKPHNHHKETHGLRSDIDENTDIKDVKAPNVFERAKEEIEALVQTIHPKKVPKNDDSHFNGIERRDDMKAELPERSNSVSAQEEKDVQAPNLIEGAKEEFEAIMHMDKSPHRHHKETHGTSDDINENTPINEVKGPNIFERAKEEIEALVQTIHPKKESGIVGSPPKKESGVRGCIGKALEKVCSPRGSKRD